MGDIIQHLPRLADYVALVYHEARNVRHPIRDRAIEPDPWKYVVALPTNRDAAWEALQRTRAEARNAKTARGVLLVFERRFRVSLVELAALYANQAWRNKAYGGNAWNGITELVRELADSLGTGRLSDAGRVLDTLGRARHNTGDVASKLQRLDRTLQVPRARE